ncbi:anti-sigma factor domain-containing protein [Streptomyces sp. NPDC057445]|uniref:anti-sigma factor domain-containing protein n=1 Tax=Streptomyces sp. NPDC057445 TaxID=3346136 RepID=UPI00367F81C9
MKIDCWVDDGDHEPHRGVRQLWSDDRGTMRPAGLLQRDGAVLMQGDPARAGAVALALEPAGGAPRPTTDPLLFLNPPARRDLPRWTEVVLPTARGDRPGAPGPTLSVRLPWHAPVASTSPATAHGTVET